MNVKFTGLVIILIFLTGMASGTILQKRFLVLNRVFVSNTPTPIAEATIPPAVYGKLELFVLAGQSNMSGRGHLPSIQVPHQHIFIFGNNYRWLTPVEPIDNDYRQVDIISAEPDAGFGPGLTFAETLLQKRTDMIVGLIPCARGGSSIVEWQPNLSDNSLYGSCLKRIKAASTMGQVAGVLFMQGETDAEISSKKPTRERVPKTWSKMFIHFAENLRKDIGVTQLPILFAQIGSHTDPTRYPNWEMVQQQQQSTQLHCSRMVKTNDLKLKDSVHFSTNSQKIIGKRFADAYLKLASKCD